MKRRDVRRKGGAKWGGPSPQTAIILGLSLIIWFAQFVPTTVYSDCEYADYWVSGWFAFSSLFQRTGVAIAAAVILWAVSFLDREWRKMWGEKMAQGAVLLALAFWFVVLKSYLFPYAAPQLKQMTAVVNALFPHDAIIFDEEWTPLAGAEDPQRPAVEFEYHPLSYPAINKNPGEIFTSRYSPTGADMKRLRQCLAEQRRALVQFEKDQATLNAYEDEKWRSAKISRPRDWREEVREELEREGPITE